MFNRHMQLERTLWLSCCCLRWLCHRVCIVDSSGPGLLYALLHFQLNADECLCVCSNASWPLPEWGKELVVQGINISLKAYSFLCLGNVPFFSSLNFYCWVMHCWGLMNRWDIFICIKKMQSFCICFKNRFHWIYVCFKLIFHEYFP